MRFCSLTVKYVAISVGDHFHRWSKLILIQFCALENSHVCEWMVLIVNGWMFGGFSSSVGVASVLMLYMCLYISAYPVCISENKFVLCQYLSLWVCFCVFFPMCIFQCMYPHVPMCVICMVCGCACTNVYLCFSVYVCVLVNVFVHMYIFFCSCVCVSVCIWG